MQLTLTPSVAPSSAPLASTPSRGLALPSRDAAASQLDRLAAAQRSSAGAGKGASVTVLALVGGLLVLGMASLWEPHAPAAAQAAVPAAQVVPPAQPVLAPLRAAPSPAAADRVLPSTPVVAPHAPAVPAPAVSPPLPDGSAGVAQADDAQRQARARQLAQARRQATQLAAERAAAEEAQRLQRAQQAREQELAQQRAADEARQRAAAAELAAQRPVALAANGPRSVVEVCAAAGGFISRQFCQARECRNAEHQADAVCVRLREIEVAQAGAMR